MVSQGRFPAEKLVKYPHMTIEDIPVWERYLDAHASEWGSFDYDVRVGTGLRDTSGLDPRFADMAQSLSKLRIDAVGYRANEICVFEVKPRAGLSAFGQIVGYRSKYVETFAPSVAVTACVVAEAVLDDVADLLATFDVRLVLV